MGGCSSGTRRGGRYQTRPLLGGEKKKDRERPPLASSTESESVGGKKGNLCHQRKASPYGTMCRGGRGGTNRSIRGLPRRKKDGEPFHPQDEGVQTRSGPLRPLKYRGCHTAAPHQNRTRREKGTVEHTLGEKKGEETKVNARAAESKAERAFCGCGIIPPERKESIGTVYFVANGSFLHEDVRECSVYLEKRKKKGGKERNPLHSICEHLKRTHSPWLPTGGRKKEKSEDLGTSSDS